MEKNSKKLLRGELIGAGIKIIESKNSYNEGLTGTIIDETKNMFTIKTKNTKKKIIKKGNKFVFMIGGKKITTPGDKIAKRPEERTKETK